MKPTIINDSGVTISEETIDHWVKGITSELARKKILSTEKKDKELGLVFLNENDAKRLNWNYRCKDYPTDILSFESDDPESLGELVICPQVIEKKAKENGTTHDEQMGYIVLHGVLHLLGYDHEKAKEDEVLMMKIQDEVFEKLRNPPKKKKVDKSDKVDKSEKIEKLERLAIAKGDSGNKSKSKSEKLAMSEASVKDAKKSTHAKVIMKTSEKKMAKVKVKAKVTKNDALKAGKKSK